MSDATYKNSSQLVSLVGADSSGQETNFVNADSYGRILISPEKHEPPSFTTLATNIALANNKSMLSIMNTNAAPIYIKEVWLSLYNSGNQPNADTAFGLYRITGHLGGTSITINSHDTNDSLPSGITALTNGTVSGETSTPLESNFWGSEDGQANTYGIFEHALATHMPFWAQSVGTKAIVLRQNQGLHIRCVGTATGANFIVRIIFTT